MATLMIHRDAKPCLARQIPAALPLLLNLLLDHDPLRGLAVSQDVGLDGALKALRGDVSLFFEALRIEKLLRNGWELL